MFRFLSCSSSVFDNQPHVSRCTVLVCPDGQPWLGRYLTVFSSVKLLFFPLQLISNSWEDTM